MAMHEALSIPSIGIVKSSASWTCDDGGGSSRPVGEKDMSFTLLCLLVPLSVSMLAYHIYYIVRLIGERPYIQPNRS